MLLHSLNQKDIKDNFSSTFYARGHDYYRSNRVHDLKISSENNEDKISATIAGSDIYYATITISGAIDKVSIKSNCTCPIGSSCKHVIATLLKALDSKPLTVIATPITKPVVAPPKNNHQPSAEDYKIDWWLKNLEATVTNTTKEKTVDETYSLRYILKFSDKTLKLNLVLVRRLKSGALGAVKDFNKNSYSHESHLFSIDHEILKKIDIAQRIENNYQAYYGYPIKGNHFEKLLPDIVATNRCHFEDVNNQIVKLTDTKTATVDWTLDNDGFQTLHFKFVDQSAGLSLFIIDQLWYAKKETGEIGIVETGIEKNLFELLLSAPKIPSGSAQRVATLFMQQEKLSTISKPKLFSNHAIEKLTPVVCLCLTSAPVKQYGLHEQTHQYYFSEKAVAILSFNYDGKVIDWFLKDDNINQVQGEQVTQYVRDRIFEKKAMDELKSHQLKLIGDIDLLRQHADNTKVSHYFLIGHDQHDPLDFTAQTIPLLRAQGWQIEINSGYPYQIIDEPIDEWYSSIDDSTGYDWFNLELGIFVQGEKINLLPVLQQLLKKLKSTHNQFDLSKNDTVLAQLQNGKYIPLPIERVQHIINVLIELYDSNSLANGDFLQLSRLQAARLLELEAAMGAAKLRWFGGEKLRVLAEKLTQFKGVEAVSVPKQFLGELRSYQQEGLNWLQFLREYEFGGILADDMGLGKTVQALSHIAVEKSAKRMTEPTLIVAPTSLMFNWRMEAERFSPHLKILVLHGSDRKQNYDSIAQYDLVLTTYPLLKFDKGILLKHTFHFLILDEAQCIKNSKSLSTQIVQQIKSKHRLCLTGTPLENHLGELWSLFHFLMPGLLGAEKQFNHIFRIPIEKNTDQDRRAHLMRRIAPFMLRRTKNNVVKELPEKVHIVRQVEIEGAQRDLYETIRVTMQKKVRQEIAKLGLSRSQIIILEALLKLRQVCCDPRLLKIDSAKKNKAKSAKLELLMELIPELLEEGRRILLFSQFTEMLELIEEELNNKKIAYVKLTGQTKDRATPVQQFQNGEIPLFIISLKAGGTGLNLTAADTVIHYDPWWNPAVEDQATDRAHRIGQNKTVFVYKLVTKGTVEEKILEMQQKKRALMEGLFSDNPSGKVALTEKDLQGFFEPLEPVVAR